MSSILSGESVPWSFPDSRALRAVEFLLVAEFTLVLKLRALTIGDYLANPDPAAGTVYLVSLGILAVMTLLVGKTRKWTPNRCEDVA